MTWAKKWQAARELNPARPDLEFGLLPERGLHEGLHERRRERRQGERLYGCFGFVVFIVTAPFTLERRRKPAILTRYFPGLEPVPRPVSIQDSAVLNQDTPDTGGTTI